jgi:hypothetical protein
MILGNSKKTHLKGMRDRPFSTDQGPFNKRDRSLRA